EGVQGEGGVVLDLGGIAEGEERGGGVPCGPGLAVDAGGQARGEVVVGWVVAVHDGPGVVDGPRCGVVVAHLRQRAGLPIDGEAHGVDAVGAAVQAVLGVGQSVEVVPVVVGDQALCGARPGDDVGDAAGFGQVEGLLGVGACRTDPAE